MYIATRNSQGCMQNRIKIGGFRDEAAKLGAVRVSMAKTVASAIWFDNLKKAEKETWASFRTAFDARWEIELKIYAKCDLFLKCQQKSDVSVRQFKDECLSAVKHYFEGFAPEEAPGTGAGSTTLKHYNEGYFDCVSHIRFVTFVNGLRPEIRTELKKIDIKTKPAVTNASGSEIVTGSEAHFDAIVEAACRIELSLSNKRPTQTAVVDNPVSDQPVAAFANQNRGRANF